MSKNKPISVVIIAKNEAENLKLSLPMLSWCNEIILIDDYSTDQTAAIAQSFGAKVFQNKFDGFGAQKQFGVAKTTYDWVLNLDADEVLSEGLVEELKQLIANEPNLAGYQLPIRHLFLGKAFRYGRESNFLHLRFFNKTKGNFDNAKVHEKVHVSGKIGQLKQVVLHHSYRSLEQYFSKFNHYTQIGAEKLFAAGKNRPILFCVISFPLYFIKHYFVYRNFLNGKQGFLWSYLSAWYHVVKYIKLNTLNYKK